MPPCSSWILFIGTLGWQVHISWASVSQLDIKTISPGISQFYFNSLLNGKWLLSHTQTVQMRLISAYFLIKYCEVLLSATV